MSIRISSRELKRAETREDFRLHCAALEWSLAEPIIINSAEDIRSRVDWQGRVEPFRHQVENLMRFCRRLPVTLLADDVGLGKTISAGLIASELIKRNRINKIFIICPKILIPQWIEELESKFGIQSESGTGRNVANAARRPAPVFITTYQSAKHFLERGNAAGFDMLILDEAHKVRNLRGTSNAPRMATAIYKSLEARAFKYVLMLTATPIQNRLWDIYSLVDCLAVARGHKNPFGSPDQFSTRFIADRRTSARKLDPRHASEFRGIVNSYMFRTRRIDAKLLFPERKVQSIPVSPGPAERQLQQEVANAIHHFPPLQQANLLVALMSSPRALAQQFQNVTSNDNLHATTAQKVQQLASSVSVPAKAQWVLQLVKDLQAKDSSWRIVIFTTRLETQAMIGEILEEHGYRCGFISGGKAAANRKAIEGFRMDPPENNIIISSDAGAEGVNLQSANILVNYDLPWNPMIVEQRIGRIQRIGSQYKSVHIANIVHVNSPEQRIVGRLMEKLQVISQTVGDIESVLESTGDGDSKKLQETIRDMVILSLQGQDQEKAASAAAQSIEKARELLEENRVKMDETLGDMHGADQVDLPMPKLEPAQPSMPYRDFVMSALSREGCEAQDNGSGLFVGHDANRSRIEFTFEQKVLNQYSKPGVFMGKIPQFFQPGKPAFERLVQRWIDQHAATWHDRRSTTDQTQALVQQWAEGISGATVVDYACEEGPCDVIGRIHCHARIANAVDSYEKLLPVDVHAQNTGHGLTAGVTATVDPKDLFPNFSRIIEEHVCNDSDIKKFHAFYDGRLRSELTKTGEGAGRTKLLNDFTPTISAEAVALDCELRGTIRVKVTYKIQGDLEYHSLLEFANGTIVAAPPKALCSVTKTELPEDCLETCQATGQRALRELLHKSDLSGNYALPSELQTCGITGKRILDTEAEKCCVTGIIAARDQLKKSDVSGRFLLPDQATSCELTNACVAPDELLLSSVSGKRFRKDEAVTIAAAKGHAHRSEATLCAVSGDWLLESDALKCPETGLLAAAGHFRQCEVSNTRVLPQGLGECCISGKKARASLLRKSDVSQKQALAEFVVQCEVSSSLLLPDELGVSDLSGKKYDLRLKQQCVVSKKTGPHSDLVASSISGDWLAPEHAILLADGTHAGRHEAAICISSASYLPLKSIRACKITGLNFEKRHLNASGEFGLVRAALDGQLDGEEFEDQGFLPRTLPKLFRGMHTCMHVGFPSGNARLLFGVKSTFGLRRRAFAVIATGETSGMTLKGRLVFGKRTRGVWELTDAIDLEE